MENAYKIKGGNPLKGEVRISGAKNIALKVLIAALLFESKVTINNIPRISDINELIHLLTQLGAKIEFENNTVVIDGKGLNTNKVDLLHASKIRASFLLFAPLLYKFGSAHIPNPGGCRLGSRSIDRVVDGMRALGVKLKYDSSTGYYEAILTDKPFGNYRFEKSSHTGTELLIMISVFNKNGVIIENGALEPEIDDLIEFLNLGGAKIKRNGSRIEIGPCEKLVQKDPFTIAADRVEAVTYAVLGMATGGDIVMDNIPFNYIKAFIEVLEMARAGYERLAENKWRFYGKSPSPAQIETSPHPGFLTDWQPLLAVFLTQASGSSVIHERIFESRFSYVDELRKLGANIEYIDYPVRDPSSHYYFNYDKEKKYSQTIQINGPQPLHGAVLTVADLRAGATLAIAAFMAKGDSYVMGIDHLERGYEDFVSKVQKLGGDIKKI